MAFFKTKYRAGGVTPFQSADNKLAFLARLYILYIFLIHPFIVGTKDPGYYANITEMKLMSFRIAVYIFMIVGIVLYAMLKYHNPGYRELPSKPKDVWRVPRVFEWSALAFWCVLMLSTALSIDPQQSLVGASARNEGFLTWTGYIIAFLMITRFAKPRQSDMLLMTIASFFVALYGLFQWYGNEFLHLIPVSFETMVGPNITHVSTMSNIDVYSPYLLLALFTSFVLFAHSDKKYVWAFLPLGLMAFHMEQTIQVDGGWVGLLGTLVLTVPLLFTNRNSIWKSFLFIGLSLPTFIIRRVSLDHIGDWKAWSPEAIATLKPMAEAQSAEILEIEPLLIVGAIACIVIAALVRFLPKLPVVPEKIYYIVYYGLVGFGAVGGIIALPILAEQTSNATIVGAAHILQGQVPDEIGSGRGFVWKKCISMWLEKPIFGYGPDQFYTAFTARFYQESVQKLGVNFDKAHNEYLQMLVDNGILGLGAMLTTLFSLAGRALRFIKKDPLTLALFVSCLCYSLQAFFNIHSQFQGPAGWVFYGLLGAQIVNREVAVEPKREKKPKAKKETNAAV
ncbi:MAG: O-antigen ligase family protein [Oscillospiraceae bacterium]|jgi:hypothetical protein|nr:O-antigen ligase family protein [Oscillospiraceae bacterium]